MRAQGFALATVTLMLALIGAAIFLVSREATTGGDRVQRSTDVAAARYAAEAGMTHAVWLANNSGCATYDLPETAFGAHKYVGNFLPAADSPVTIDVKGTSDTGTVARLVKANLPIFDTAQPRTVALQPGPEGDDTFIEGQSGHTNHNKAHDQLLRTNPETNKQYRSLLRFDLGDIPAGARVVSATLEIEVETNTGGGDDITVHRVSRAWTESFATWDNYGFFLWWTTDGGDYDPTPVGSFWVDSLGRKSVDVTSAAKAWIEAGQPNEGLILIGQGNGDLEKRYYSSDHSDASRRPKLTLTYLCECGQLCLGTAGGNLLMVVVDPDSLTPQEDAKRSLIESWGYLVSLIDEADTQANFDAAIAANHVVFVTEDVSSGTVGNKLSAAPIGVVIEEDNLSDELGLSTGIEWESTQALNVDDNTHSITEPFALGTLQVLTSTQSVARLTGTLAPDLAQLASLSGEPMLVALEAGATTHLGGTSPGHRVMLPWGGNNMEVAFLTSDGLTIFRRALDWASGGGPTGPKTLILATQSSATLGGLTFTDKDLAEYEPINDLATLYFDGAGYGLAQDIDAVHLLPNGHIVLSAINTITLGGVTGENEDLIDYDPVSDVGTRIFDGSTLFTDGSTDISAVHVMSSGRYLLTNEYSATLGGLSFEPSDIIDYNADTDTATMFLDGSSVGLNEWIDAVNLLENGNIVLSTETDATLGGLSFTDGDLVEYDMANDTATLYFDGALFSETENVRAAYIESGGGGGGPAGFSVLFVVGDPENLTPEQIQKRDLIEGWGHTMSYIATASTQEEFDDAVAGVAVVYVPELGTGPMGELGDKLDDAAKGLITEESRKAFLMGSFMLLPFVTTDSIDITDNSHYLTAPLPLGPLTLSSSEQSMWKLGGTLAVDLHILGELGGGPGLAYLDAGELRNDSTPAPARRVKLPWGAYSFDVSLLTPEALGIMQRAIEWAAGAGGGGGGGGPTCAGTIADDFETGDYTGNTGSAPWNGNWVEVNESTNPTSGDERVVGLDGGHVVRVRDNDGGGEGILRSADLSAYTSAVLSFDYWRDGLDNANDYVVVEAWPNGSGEWEEVFRIEGPGDDPTGSPLSQDVDISAFIMNDTHLRFITSPTMGNTDAVLFDNIEICGN